MAEHGFYHPDRGYWQTTGAPSEATLASYPEGTVEVPLKPVRAGFDHAWDGTQWVESAAAPVPPDTAPAWKCKVVLAQQPAQGAGPTLLDDIAAWVATQDRASQIAFSEASEWSRVGAFMAAAQAQFGITDAQRDEWFIAASQVSV